MPGMSQPNSLRLFISHSWEDKPAARLLEADLTNAGVEVWIDHSGTKAGDNLPKRISEALGWANCLLLLWSASASTSRWVELEWTNAVALGRTVIPCVLDHTPLPPILSNILYLSFIDFGAGRMRLLHEVELISTHRQVTGSRESAVAVTDTVRQAIEGAPLARIQKPPGVVLRWKAREGLSPAEVNGFLRGQNVFDAHRRPNGAGIRHGYEMFEARNGSLVRDRTTCLTWQRQGSTKALKWPEAEAYVAECNDEGFGGLDGWRLPTIEEAATLLEPSGTFRFVSSVFDFQQSWIWTADKSTAHGSVWYVSFIEGCCGSIGMFAKCFARAVRSGLAL